MSNLLAILGDCHIGARNNSLIFDSQAKQFFSEVFFPTLKARGCRSIIQVGDLFDNRKSMNLGILGEANEYLFKPLQDFETAFIIGNHDSYFKNSLAINSQRLFLDEQPEWEFIDEPTSFFGADMVPWICDANYQDTMQLIENSKAEYCFGHLELAGFKNNSHVMKDGMSPDIFKRYKRVFTGHYHGKQVQGNILYVGTPYELTWSDFGEEKGFHILDVDTGELEFIKNPYTMHQKIHYSPDPHRHIPVGNITGKIIRVVVDEKGDQKVFDAFIRSLEEQNPYELRISESLVEYDADNETEIDLDIDSTPVIIEKYIDNCELSLDKPRLNTMFMELHAEAVRL